MKFAAEKKSDFKQCPEGNHLAICNMIADMGLQPGSDAYPTPKHQVYVRFELPTERLTYTKEGVETEGPMSIGRTFTASMNEKANLRIFIEGWFGKKFPSDEAAASFDLKDVLGRKCLVNVTHTAKGGKTYANLIGATPIPKGMASDQPQENASVYFSLDEAPGDVDRNFAKLPEWLQKKIEGRMLKERDLAKSAPVSAPDFDDDLPF
jgi:hypothetical protein